VTKAMRIEKIPSARAIQSFYDTIAEMAGYQERMYQADFQKQRLGRVKELLAPMLPLCQKVLEVGCADGMLTRWLAERVAHVVAIDRARPCIERCEKLGLEDVTFVHGTLRTVKDTDFDLAVASEVLEHCVDPEAEVERLRGMAKVILATVPISEMPNERAFFVDAYLQPEKAGDGSGHIWAFRPDTFKALFSEIQHYEDNSLSAIVIGR